MAYMGPVLPTSLEGIQNDSTAANNQPEPNPCIAANRQLCVAGQTANTRAGNGANQQGGTFSIPAGTASGGTVLVPNTLVGPNSLVFLQPRGNGGSLTTVGVTALTAGASFTVTVFGSGPTTAAVDCWYLIVN